MEGALHVVCAYRGRCALDVGAPLCRRTSTLITLFTLRISTADLLKFLACKLKADAQVRGPRPQVSAVALRKNTKMLRS